MENFLVYTALFFYALNYIVGWLLYFKRITMTKQTHQILFAFIITSLLALLLLYPSLLILPSFICMLLLPFGKKGGRYHITVSTLGIIFFGLFTLVKFLTD